MIRYMHLNLDKALFDIRFFLYLKLHILNIQYCLEILEHEHVISVML